MDANGNRIAGATLSILDSFGNTAATAATDITGFYVFATTGVLGFNSNYSLGVTGFPGAFVSSTPQSDQFTWARTGMMFNFVLN